MKLVKPGWNFVESVFESRQRESTECFNDFKLQ